MNKILIGRLGVRAVGMAALALPFLMACGGGGGGGSTTPAIVQSAPTISIQPQGQWVVPQAPATFFVTAAGNPAPTYQWNLNGTAIPNATLASYITPPATAPMSGQNYTVTVTNAGGTVTSSPAAVLTVTTASTPYSSSTIEGPWLITPSVLNPNDWITFNIIADGNGVLTNIGEILPGATPGIYSVTPDGAVEITLNSQGYNYIGTGNLTTSASGAVSGSVTFSNTVLCNISPVTDLSACQGTWTGTLTETVGGSSTYPITITVDGNGNITSLKSGFSSIISGPSYMFSESASQSGSATLFIVSTVSGGISSTFAELAMAGIVSGNNFAGLFTNVCGCISGTVNLTNTKS